MASTTESKPSRANMLWTNKVLDIGRQILPNVALNGIGELPKGFYNHMGELISTALPEENKPYHDSRIWQLNLSRSRAFSADSIAYIVYETARWQDFNPELANAWLGKTIPRLFSIASLNSKENDLNSANQALNLMTRQVGEKQLNFLIPLCPSYDYIQDQQGFFKHQSGKIMPTIGSRFNQAIEGLTEVFSPLESLGVNINYQFLTYSGETNNLEYLSDLGQDVLEYYQNNYYQLFYDLQASFSDLGQKTNSNPLSMDYLFGETIAEKVNQFLSQFPPETHRQEFLPTINSWIQADWEFSPHWFIHYFNQELKYRKTQAGLIQSQNNLIPAALREGLLYSSVIDFANQNNAIIIDLETEPLYMMGELEFTPGPCLVAKGYDRQKPDNPFSIRQPYNL